MMDEADEWRDGVVTYLIKELPDSALSFAVMHAEDGEEFNAAVWAAAELWDIVYCHSLIYPD